MDFVKNQFQRIQQQLTGLTASQKMLTGALVAIMVMTLLYWGRYAGTAELEPILEQDFDQATVARITQQLQAKKIIYKVDGNRVLVPADQKMEALADLFYTRALTQNTESGFDQMVSKSNPWASQSERESLNNRGKEITCEQLIRMFPDVEQARVVIDPTWKRQIGAGNIQPSATVNIVMRAGSSSIRQVADAAGAVVKGAEAALTMERISMIVNGSPYRLRDAGDNGGLIATGDDQLTLRIKHEENQREKIQQLLGDIPGLLLSVSVSLDTDIVETDQQKMDATNTLSKERRIESTETETNSGSAGEEPGVNPNVAVNTPLDISGGGGTSSRETIEKTDMEILPSFSHTKTRSTPGGATVVSASVRVPLSYFEKSLSRRMQNKPPTPEQLDAYVEQRKQSMIDVVRASAGMTPDTLVAVDAYADDLQIESAAVPQTATMSIPVAIGSHGKEIALGALAVVSLFMVSMMVKKSTPAPVIAASIPTGPPPTLVGGEMVAGEAGAGNPLLDGMELDDDAVRTQQMLDQVSTMVKDNPDGAAALVKRWMNRD